MPCTPIRQNARGGTGPILVPYSTRRNSAPGRTGTRANNFCGACEGQPPTADEQTAADLASYLVELFPLGIAGDQRGRAWGSKAFGSPSGLGTTAGHIRQATTFTKPGAWLRLGSGPFNNGDRVTWTVTFWLRFDSGSTPYTGIFTRFSGSEFDWMFGVDLPNETRPFFEFFRNDGGASAGVRAADGELTAGVWHFVRLWYDAAGNSAGMKIDDNPAHLLAIPWTIGWHSAVPTRLGCTSNAGDPRGFSGAAEQLATWERVLTDDEHAFLFNAGAGREYPWPLGCAVSSSRSGSCTGAPGIIRPYEDWLNPLVTHSIRPSDRSQFIWLWVDRICHRPDVSATAWEMFWHARVEMIGASRSASPTTPPHPALVNWYAPAWQSGSWVYEGHVEVSTYFEDGGSGQHDFRGWKLFPLTRTVELHAQQV